MNHIDVLKGCTVEGLVVKLPPEQLDRKLYLEVANSLQLSGGKWKGGKVLGFVFPTDPTDLLAQIAGGEKRNLKKEFQFFGTPDALADELVADAYMSDDDRVLEPSAGQGAIIKAIRRRRPSLRVDYCELMDVNRTLLDRIPNLFMLHYDFLALRPGVIPYTPYTRIIANPPFSKNQDIDHIRMMYHCCAAGGRIVTLSSPHWQMSNNKKETAFREWLGEINADISDVPAGVFSESGTEVRTVKIIIDK